MSYCRWGGDSAVYVYGTGKVIVCCMCTLAPEDSDAVFREPQGMLEHLEAHRSKGDAVPEYALERLRREIAEAAEPPKTGGKPLPCPFGIPENEGVDGQPGEPDDA